MCSFVEICDLSVLLVVESCVVILGVGIYLRPKLSNLNSDMLSFLLDKLCIFLFVIIVSNLCSGNLSNECKYLSDILGFRGRCRVFLSHGWYR